MKKGLFLAFTLGVNMIYAQGINVSANVTDVLCHGDYQGSIELQISGGTEPYTVNWSHGASGSILTGLSNGSYFVQVVDANGLLGYKIIHVDGPDTPLTITGTGTSLSGFNTMDGEVEAQVQGGSPFKTVNEPYILQWSNGVNNTLFQDGLPAGLYTLTATDRNGCTANKQFILTQSFQVLPIQFENDYAVNIQVAPNPSTGDVIFWTTKKVKKAYVINAVNGAIIPVDMSEGKVELKGLKNGNYTVVVELNDGTLHSERMVVIN